jgi:hypothetical protein
MSLTIFGRTRTVSLLDLSIGKHWFDTLKFRSFGGGLMVGVTREVTWVCVILG